MLDTHRQAFIEEASELLSELESSLLELESAPANAELIAGIFRALHTIKGSSAMFGFDGIAMFTHDIESVYDFIRKGQLEVTSRIIDVTLAACDQVGKMLQMDEKHDVLDEVKAKEILSAFKEIAQSVQQGSAEQEKAKVVNEPEPEKTSSGQKTVFSILFKPFEQLLITGTNPLLLIEELRGLGETFTCMHTDRVPVFEELNPELCYTSWEIILSTTADKNALQDVFIFVEGECELSIAEIKKISDTEESELFEMLHTRYENDALFNEGTLKAFLDKYYAEASPVVREVVPGKKSETAETPGHEADTASSIRVSAEKLDELVNLVGELVTVQARLSQLALSAENPQFSAVSEEVERIAWSLRDSALNIRMLPIGTTFSKFKRLVRSLSKELGKEVELTTDGAETELDKTVIEKMSDPLIHIIRNSIDHGIELPDQRTAAGKNPVGTVHLSASQAGGNVLIRISDDGAGLNKEAIRLKAVAQGLISESAELSDNEIYTLIFLPGFSTAKAVTNVSGRGVGMDVVKKAITNLRGSVEIQSKFGVGTTITLKLPLTLAIIDGLLVDINASHYILPLSSVEECIELSKADRERSHKRNLVNVRGELVPYIDLRDYFVISGEKPELEQVVIAGIDGMRVGFVVDSVVGQHQTVLKSLGKVFRKVEGISGATILGDGQVALILDINKLVEKAELEERTQHA